MQGPDPQAAELLAALPWPLLLLDGSGQVQAVNPACSAQFGPAAQAWTGRALGACLPIPGLDELLEAARAGGQVERELKLAVADQGKRPLRLALRAWPGGLLLALQDLSGQRQRERLLLEAQARAGLGAWRLELRERGSRLTPEARRIYGLGEDEVVDFERLLQCVHPDDRERVHAAWRDALAGEAYAVEHRVVVNGQVRWVEARGQLETDGEGQALRMVGSVLDITRHKQAEEDVRQLIHYDPLTRLPNRNMARLQLENLLAAGNGPVAVLVLDLERFKEVNARDGREAGDEVLVQVAQVLAPLPGRGATLARVGGDEFMVLLPGVGLEGAVAMAERLLHGLEQPLQLSGRSLPLRASVGVAVSPDDGRQASELIRHAEVAVHDAMAAGGNRYGLYRRQLSSAQRRRIQLGSRLEAALRSGQLVLHYQPKLDLASRLLVGVEALARWYDLELGWVSPMEFVPLAEERGLIDLLGDWALERAVQDYRRWSRRRALPWRVAVNVSARQLARPDFAEHAQAVVHAAGGRPADVELELTETAMAIDPEQACLMARRLGEAGFTLALDDFGTAYSSLSQLHRFRLDRLKIDLGFVQGVLERPGYQAIVGAVVGMARAMDMVVVAEGIETVEQAECLRALGCQQGQGFLWGKPMPADEFAREWLRDGLALA